MVLLPGRGPCHCKSGSLPYTLSVTPDGFVNKGYLQDTQGQPVPFSACFGSGAIAEFVVRLPADAANEQMADPDWTFNGTIEAVKLWYGGSGYAIKGRVEPEIAISTPDLHGAECTYTPTLAVHSLECSACYKHWSIDLVEIACSNSPEVPEVRPAGGAASATVAVKSGRQGDYGATVTVNYESAMPVVTASVIGGRGASLSVTMVAGATAWGVQSIAVDEAGEGYTDGAAVTFTCDQMTFSPAIATISTVIESPTMKAEVLSFAGGSGALLSVETKLLDAEGPSRYVVTGLSIDSGGSDYAVGDEVRILTTDVSDGTKAGCFVPPPHVSSVGDNGEIEAISFEANDECKFWRDTGVIQSVSVLDAGGYCWPVPTSVEVGNEENAPDGAPHGGFYYDESDDEPPCVSEPWLRDAYDFLLSEGQVTGVVSTEPDCTFGKIVGATVNDPGIPNTHWGTSPPLVLPCFEDPITAVANRTSPLVYFPVSSQFGSGAYIAFGYGGSRCSEDAHLNQARVAPTLTASAAPGSGGVFDITLEETTTPASPNQSRDTNPAWRIASIKASGGCEYEDGSPVSFSIQAATVVTQPEATLQAENGTITGVTLANPGEFYSTFPWSGEPTGIELVTVEDGGSGYAVYGREQPSELWFKVFGPWNPVFAQHEDDYGRPWWSIESIEVGEEGGGCSDGQPLGIWFATAGDESSPYWPEVAEIPFEGIIRTQRVEPTLTASVGTGSGAEFSVTVEPTDSTPDPTWMVASIAVTNGGSGYFTLDKTVQISLASGVTVSPASATATVGPNGVITGVTLNSPGEYYATNDVPNRVEITNHGKLWRENKDLPALVAQVTVGVAQVPPSSGTGAELGHPEIDTDPYSPAFGSITKISSVVSEGGGYTPFAASRCEWVSPCGSSSTMPLAVMSIPSGLAGFGIWDGETERPLERLDGRRLLVQFGVPFEYVFDPEGTPSNTDFPQFYLTDEMPSGCESLPVEATSPNADGTLTIGVGGAYVPAPCTHSAIPPCESLPCATLPAGMTATATVSITVPQYPNVQPQVGLVDLPVCCEGEHTATDIPLAFSCDAPDALLAGTADMDQPAGQCPDEPMSCQVKITQDDSCALYLEVTFTGNCKERYEAGQDGFERAVQLVAIVGPLGYTVNGSGRIVPDDIEDVDISFDQENDYPASISVTFNA